MMYNERRKKRIIDIRDHTEAMSHKVVDKDVQTMFLPFTLMQIILLSPKYRIKNNVITANNLFNKVLSICGTVLFSTLYSLRFFRIMKQELHNLSNVQIGFYYNFCYHIFGFIINFVFDLIQTESYVLFILIIQDVYRFGFNKYTTNFVKRSWIHVAAITCFYISYSVLCYVLCSDIITFSANIGRVALINFDINIVYAIRFIKLLENIVIQWSHQVLHSFNGDQNDMCRKRLFHTNLKILKCYQMYKNLFHHVILFYTAHNFLQTLVFNEMYIFFCKHTIGTNNNEFNSAIISSVVVYVWMFKNLVLQAILCLNCEAFYIAMENSQDVCAYILTLNCTEEEKKLCKNVRRVHRASFSKMRACRLFYVDVCLLLHLAALLTNYTVVLLQFAFL